MLIKIVVVVVLLIIAFSLFGALRSLVSGKQDDQYRTVRFLAYRVGFSVVLLLLLGLAFFMGWIQPHGLRG